MVKLTPGVTARRIAIRLRATPDGSEAEVTYCQTSLGPEGDAVVGAFTEDFYVPFMQAWETRLNHSLRHGTALRDDRGDRRRGRCQVPAALPPRRPLPRRRPRSEPRGSAADPVAFVPGERLEYHSSNP